MTSVLTRVLMAAVLATMGVLAWQAQAGPLAHSATFAPVGAQTSVPYGWLDFCDRRPHECDVALLPALDVNLNSRAWKVLNRINRQVNDFIEPVSNMDHWGTMLDHWDYPVDGKGDCKIYALYKRKLLMDEGFPRQALLMTVVKDLHGEGHTILTVKTTNGEFVLDNLTDELRPWNATGYRYLKRQTQEDPNVWVSLDGAANFSARADR